MHQARGSDPAELNRQMRYMHKIYKGAEEVGKVMDYIAGLEPKDAKKGSVEWKNKNRIENANPHILESDDLGCATNGG
jgi:hypothetical protein